MCLKLSPVGSKAGGKDQQMLNMANWSGVNNCLHLIACLKTDDTTLLKQIWQVLS